MNKDRKFEKEESKQSSKDSFTGDDKSSSRTKPVEKKFHKRGSSGKGVYKDKHNVPERNDWSFYAASENIARDIASIPFNVMGGMDFPIQVDAKQNNTFLHTNTKQPLPSIMVMQYVNSVGKTNQRTDGVNMAATQLYSYVRHANSGARNYEAADIMMYVLAMRDIYSEYFECKRLIGLARLFNYYNHNLPDLLIRSLGIDPVDLRANLSIYRGQLNLLAEKINSLAIPKYFKAFDRTAYISSYVFADSSSLRGQFYAFRRQGYYTWSGTTSQSGTELVYNDVFKDNIMITMAEKLEMLTDMLNAIFLDEDALTMSGDIIKAFSEKDLYTVVDVPIDYAVVPVMDEDILAQIENANFFKGVYPTELRQMNVQQSNQLITWNPLSVEKSTSTDPIYWEFKNRAFNSHKDEPDYKDVLEWSRLMITMTATEANVTGGSEITYALDSCGLELLIKAYIFQYKSDKTVLAREVQQLFPLYEQLIDANYMVNLGDIQIFDWHPIAYLLDHNSPTNDIHVVGDLKVTTVISENNIRQINNAAVYAAFYGDKLY